jgi:hypothetical protein
VTCYLIVWHNWVFLVWICWVKLGGSILVEGFIFRFLYDFFFFLCVGFFFFFYMKLLH